MPGWKAISTRMLLWSIIFVSYNLRCCFSPGAEAGIASMFSNFYHLVSIFAGSHRFDSDKRNSKWRLRSDQQESLVRQIAAVLIFHVVFWPLPLSRSLSFVLATGSMAFLLLLSFYIIIDVTHVWSGEPLIYPGMLWSSHLIAASRQKVGTQRSRAACNNF